MIILYGLLVLGLIIAIGELYFRFILNSPGSLDSHYCEFAQAYDEFDADIFKKRVYTIKNRVIASPYVVYKLPTTKGEYEAGNILDINSRGFRAPEPSLKKNGTFRICVLGGSLAFGASAMRNELAIPAILETELNLIAGRKKIFEVINCAVPGYVATQELLLLQTEVLDLYSPDMVIFLDGINDFISALANRKAAFPIVWKDYARIMDAFISRRYDAIFKQIALNEILRRSLFLSAIERSAKKIFFSKSKSELISLNGSLIKEAARCYYNAHVQASLITRGRNISFVSAMQPTIGYGKKARSQFEEKRIKQHYLSVYGDAYFKYLKCYYDTARDLFASDRNNIDSIDLTDAFDEERGTIFIDSVHTGDKGAKIISKKLAGAILSKGII